MSAKTVLLIDNVHMGMSHDGLAAIARRLKADPAKLLPGEILMFLNRAKDKMKVMGGGGLVIGYLRMPEGKKIALDAIQFIPQALGADGSIHYDTALRLALTSMLGKRDERKKRPVVQAYRPGGA